jgi:hypothetical protein
MLMLLTPGAPRESYFQALAGIAAGRKFSKEEWREFVPNRYVNNSEGMP